MCRFTRGQVALERPLRGYDPHRWFYIGPDGLTSHYFGTRKQAVESYEAESAALEQRHMDTLPQGAVPMGFLASGDHAETYGITYSATGSSVGSASSARADATASTASVLPRSPRAALRR